MVVQRTYTKMTRKGQITVPAEVRKKLGLHPGDRIEVTIHEGEPSTARIESAPSIVDATFGAFKSEHVVPVEEERRLARQARADYLMRKHAADDA